MPLDTASGANSHAEGYQTKASSYTHHVQGNYNIEDTEKIVSSPVKNEQDKQALLDSFKQLNEDSNPVLLIATLK